MNDEVWLKLAKRVNEVLAVAGRRRRRHHARHRHDGGDQLLPEPRRPRATSRSCWSARCGRRRPSAPTARATSTTAWPSPPIARRARDAACSSCSTTRSTTRATSRRPTRRASQTFKSLEPRPGRPGAHRQDRLVRADGPQARHGHASSRSTGSTQLPRVDIIYAHANMSPDLIDAAVKNGAQGPRDRRRRRRQHDRAGARARSRRRRRPASSSCAARGCPTGSCCATTRSTTTRWASSPRASSTPRKSRVLLQLALTKTNDPVQIQQMFDEY